MLHASNRPLRPLAVLAAASIALAVAEASQAQTQVQGGRVGTNITGTRAGNQPQGMTRPGQYLPGRGQGLGDGNALGGQTFSWLRSAGAGRTLGSGNSLDANPQVGSGGANTGTVPVDYGSRNLLVTGSVPGGRGFRGSVGYTADTDFRARVGSDDNYFFRADSAFSNPAFATSPIARDRFMVAQGLGVFEYRRESTPIGSDLQRTINDQPDSRLRLDRANAQMAIGRTNWDIGADRTIANSQTQKGEPLRYVISPLRGLQIEILTDPMARAGMSVYERARARQDLALGLTTMDDYARIRPGMELDTPDPRRLDKRLSPASEADRLKLESSKIVPKSYLDIVDAVNKPQGDMTKPDGTKIDGTTKPGEKAPTPLDRIRETLDGLRARPRDAGDDAASKSDPTKSDPSKSDPSRSDSRKPDATKSSTGDGKLESLIAPDGKPRDGEAGREVDREKRRGILIPVEEAAKILRHGKTIDTLGVDDRRRVDELVKQGESALREGDYFRAERRFEQAQALAADNPLTEAGIAHAQLGAGLYLSASLTIRNLFISFPELIDAKYDRALLPTKDRLDKAVAIMRDRADRGDDSPSYGVLLAYIGHQTGDRKLVEEGLALVKGSEKLDESRKLLEGVWLGTGQ